MDSIWQQFFDGTVGDIALATAFIVVLWWARFNGYGKE